jgi:16S rRNA (uracil1498-N3)-methyltransferase
MRKSHLLDPVRYAGALALGQTIALDAPALAALAFREVNVSEAFTIVDESGRFFRASLKQPDQALVYEAFAASPESPARITLFCAILSRQRMILVTQKAAEFGCDAMVPVLTQHSVQRGPALEKEKPWAWRGQGIKGSRQCRRGSVMQVVDATSFADALKLPAWTDAKARFFLDDRADAKPVNFAELGTGGSYALFVGPEGGLSDAERASLSSHGGVPLRLGSRVLRAETAVFAGLSVLQHRLGDLS